MSWADGPLLSGLVNPAVPIAPAAQGGSGTSGADVRAASLGAAP